MICCFQEKNASVDFVAEIPYLSPASIRRHTSKHYIPKSITLYLKSESVCTETTFTDPERG